MENDIKTYRKKNCLICGEEGDYMYLNMADVMFQTSGLWNVKRCKNISCKTLWLDPSPTSDDLYKLYTKYSTHQSYEEKEIFTSNKSLKSKILDLIRESIYNSVLKYPSNLPKYYIFFMNIFSYLFPGWREAQLINRFYIPYIEKAKMLDVGCGNGDVLSKFKKIGFEVEGVDFDEKAINVAKDRGYKVTVSDIFSMKYPDNFFDVVFTSHVIEHVPDPIVFLKECKRILKKGGVYIAITPNSNSFGSMYYGKDWRGLEIPRHLNIFTTKSLQKAGEIAGFEYSKCKTTVQGQSYILRASSEIKKYNISDYFPYKYNKFLFTIAFTVYGWFRFLINGKEETNILICKK